MRTTRMSRRTRSTILLLCILFFLLASYLYLFSFETPSNPPRTFIGRHSYESEPDSHPHHDLLPMMPAKDTLSKLKREEEEVEMLRFKTKSRTPVKKTAEEKADARKVKDFKEKLRRRRQREHGVPRGGSVVIKFDNLTIHTMDISRSYVSWQKHLGPQTAVESSVDGIFPEKFRPEVGNGHIAAVVFSNCLHMNNFFIGKGKKSRR